MAVGDQTSFFIVFFFRSPGLSLAGDFYSIPCQKYSHRQRFFHNKIRCKINAASKKLQFSPKQFILPQIDFEIGILPSGQDN